MPRPPTRELLGHRLVTASQNGLPGRAIHLDEAGLGARPEELPAVGVVHPHRVLVVKQPVVVVDETIRYPVLAGAQYAYVLAGRARQGVTPLALVALVRVQRLVQQRTRCRRSPRARSSARWSSHGRSRSQVGSGSFAR